ncbi:MAG: DUF1464 family protein [Sulfolobales archaeon]
MRILAIDPGTLTTAVAVGDEKNIEFYYEVNSEELSKRPEHLFEIINSLDPDLVVAPSGYGLPPIDLRKIESKYRSAALLKYFDDPGIEELRFISFFLNNIDSLKMPVIGLPSIYNLITVPEYRIYNRVDLGTSDKTALAILASVIYSGEDIERLKRANIIVVELGAFTAGIAIANGEIIDGVGGSLFPIGLVSRGGLDTEIAVLMRRRIYKRDVFSGGLRDLCGTTDLEEIRARCPTAYDRYIDDIAKTIAMLEVSIRKNSKIRDGVKIYLSGRGASLMIINSLKEYGFEEIDILPSYYGRPHIKRSVEGSLLYGLLWSGVKNKDILYVLGVLRGYREIKYYKDLLIEKLSSS